MVILQPRGVSQIIRTDMGVLVHAMIKRELVSSAPTMSGMLKNFARRQLVSASRIEGG
jgi:hypothetical protein